MQRIDEMEYVHQMIAVTNRHYVMSSKGENSESDLADRFCSRLEQIAALHPKAIVLREKDLSEDEYFRLAGLVGAALQGSNVPVLLHNYYRRGLLPGFAGIHLPFPVLQALYRQDRERLAKFPTIGTSVHAVTEALEAQQLGASYLFAGNIWETSCKPGKPAAGLDFLHSVAESVDIPVYAIGGVSITKMPDILAAGAAGGAMMSGFMCDGDHKQRH